MEAYEKFNKLIEELGQTAFLDEIRAYMSDDYMNEMCDDIANLYDVEMEDKYE